MKRRLAIIHFNPIELYPPVLNWLNYVAAYKDWQVDVYTSGMEGALFERSSPAVRIIRNGRFRGRSAPVRYINYFIFYLVTTIRLVASRPDVVLYYETLSAFPAILYKRIGRRNAALFIHYHEYTSPEEYRDSMALNRWLHKLEKKIYARAAWISHTNQDRMDRFLTDTGLRGLSSARLLPNFPPS